MVGVFVIPPVHRSLPIVSSVNSGSPVDLSTARQWVTVQGTNFQPGYSATFWGPSGTPFLIDSARLQFVDASILNMYVGLTVAGTWNVQVTNPDGGVSNELPFNVVESGRVSTPQFTPAPGTYSGSVSVSMTCATSGATIRYTKDGNDPTSLSTAYSGTPVSITATTTLKAKGFLTGSTSSTINTGVYVISSTGTLSPPTFSPDPGQTYTGSVGVYMYASPSTATIRYTMDGSDPTQSTGWTYNGSPVAIGSTTPFKARAFYSGWNPSSTSSATYTIAQNAVSTPYFSPPPGNYAQAPTVSVYCDTPGALIRYTFDSSDPTETHGFDYSGPMQQGNGTLRVRAFKTGWPPSAIAVGTWSITPPTPAPIQCSPASVTVTVSKENHYTSLDLTLSNTTDKTIVPAVSIVSV